MPYKRSARFTVTNEGTQEVGSLLLEHRLHDGAEAAGRRALLPCAVPAERAVRAGGWRPDAKLNPGRQAELRLLETRGRGHLMGVTLGVLQNANGWWGEGDDMIFIDDESKPAIIGTGQRRLFPGELEFRRPRGATPFAHRACTARR